eukprot:6580955-Alexandrium_andersonii.AAC.1
MRNEPRTGGEQEKSTAEAASDPLGGALPLPVCPVCCGCAAGVGAAAVAAVGAAAAAAADAAGVAAPGGPCTDPARPSSSP